MDPESFSPIVQMVDPFRGDFSLAGVEKKSQGLLSSY